VMLRLWVSKNLAVEVDSGRAMKSAAVHGYNPRESREPR